jgi:uncharacterized protein (DUF58 family)
MTRAGRTYVVLAVGVGLGALNTGNNLLYLVLGLLLSMIVVSGVLSERCLNGLSVRRLGADAVYAGEPCAFRWVLSRKRGHGFALTVAEHGVPLTGEGLAPWVQPGADYVVRARVTAPRRGPMRLGAVRITTLWPLGLFAKTRVVPLEGLLLVYPRRGYACRDPSEAEQGPVGESSSAKRLDGTGDVAGLRELGPQEDARRVHWLKSATAGKLLKVEREREERRTYMLTVPSDLAGEALDHQCEEVAALAHRLLEAGHEVGLELPGERLRPGAGTAQERRILQALAWVGFDQEREEVAA